MWVFCLHMSVHHMHAGALRGQKRASDRLEPGKVVRLCVGVLVGEPWSSGGEQTLLLTAEPSCRPQHF